MENNKKMKSEGLLKECVGPFLLAFVGGYILLNAMVVFASKLSLWF